MSNGSSNRLDKVERILEAVAQQQEINTRTLELLGQRVDSNAKSIEANSAAIAATNAAITATSASVDGLVQTITEFSIRTEARLNKLDEAITGISATNQRLEEILQELIRRRDRNGNGNQPQP